MRIEFHTDNGEMITPIEVANALINHTTHYEASRICPSLIPERDDKTFTYDELSELAEYLLVFCKYNNKTE